MVVIKRKFFHMRQSLKRFRANWFRKAYDKFWLRWKREKRIK
ncbi:MAG: hypothetical protein QMD14_01730 [Candidatus Aenigmarchaeota archaeon]|nr:hypothetical protein [Candidatus Aenigmarchaeota archaeon]